MKKDKREMKSKSVKQQKPELDIIDLDNTIELGNILEGLKDIEYEEETEVESSYATGIYGPEELETEFADDMEYEEYYEDDLEDYSEDYSEEYSDEYEEEYAEDELADQEYTDEIYDEEYLDENDSEVQYDEDSSEMYSDEEMENDGSLPDEDPEDFYYTMTDLSGLVSEYDEDTEEEEFVREENRKRKQREEAYKNDVPVIRFFKYLSPSDYVIAAGVVVVFLVVLGFILWPSNSVKKENIDYTGLNQVGQDYASLSLPGEYGMSQMTMHAIDASASIQEEEEAEPEETAEEEEQGQITAELKFTSVEKDLKIKFINKESGKLISGQEFDITLKSSAGKEIGLKDTDKDGILYESGLEGGKYSITVAELEGYTFTGIDSQIEVKGKIEYKKVDVKEEIKSESEVNVAQEDTAGNNVTEEKPTVTDTVEWVESTRTSLDGGDEYQPIKKEDIVVPESAGAETVNVNLPENLGVASPKVIFGIIKRDPEKQEEKKEEKEEDKLISLTISDEKKELKVGETYKLTAIAATEEGTTLKSEENDGFKFTSSDESVATVGGKGKITAVKAGTAEITVSIKDKTAICTVTVVEDSKDDDKDDDKKDDETPSDNNIFSELTLSATTISVGIDEKYELKATAKNGKGEVLTDNPEKFTWESLDETIATVGSKGKVKGVKEGTTTVSVSYTKDGVTKKTDCQVTVTKEPSKKPDKDTPLKTKDGKSVYVKDDNGEYRVAVYADYDTHTEFFTEMDKARYKYTGWQTIDGNVYFFDKDGNKVTGTQVIKGVTYNFTEEGILATDKNGILGIDVSSWNGSIDWTSVKNSGVSFVVIRCGYRGSATGALVEDAKFRGNIQGAQAAGLKVGVYFFTQAINEVEAVEEASMVVEILKSFGIGYPVFIDTEKTVSGHGRADGLDKTTRTAVVKAFCQTIKNSGYTAGVYASKAWYNDDLDYSQLSGFKIWLAQYASEPTFNKHYDMWQYSAKGTVSGIKGNVDMNFSYLGY